MVQQPLLPHQPAVGGRHIVHPRHPHVRSADGVGLLPQSRHHQPVRLYDAARRGRLHVEHPGEAGRAAGHAAQCRRKPGPSAGRHPRRNGKGQGQITRGVADGRRTAAHDTAFGRRNGDRRHRQRPRLDAGADRCTRCSVAVHGVRDEAGHRGAKRVRLRIRLYEGHHCDRRHLRGKHIRPASFKRKDLAEIQITTQRFHQPAACLGIGAGHRCLKPFRECGIPANFR